MKIGLDIHGVIDTYPDFFSELVITLLKGNHEVHVLTGATFEHAIHKLKKANVLFSHFFSITDYHIAKGTEITFDDVGEPHMDKTLWDIAKADYCHRNKIDLHLDDSIKYGKHFRTPFLHVQENIKELIVYYPDKIIFLGITEIVFPIMKGEYRRIWQTNLNKQKNT